MWTPAVAAVLGRKDIRKAVLPKPEFLAAAREVLDTSGVGQAPRPGAPWSSTTRTWSWCTVPAARGSSSR